MGSSKPREVITVARQLLKDHEGEFSRDFGKNKTTVKQYIESPNPTTVNKVAGAISSAMRIKANKKPK